MITASQAIAALVAYDESLYGRSGTLPQRVDAMRAAIEAATKSQGVAMCETCFTTWPIDNAPAVCPVCNKGRV